MQKSKACLVSGALWANPSNLLFSNHLLYHLPQTHILQHNAYISASQAFLITEFRSQVIKQRVKKPFCPRMLELSSVISHTVLIAKKVLWFLFSDAGYVSYLIYLMATIQWHICVYMCVHVCQLLQMAPSDQTCNNVFKPHSIGRSKRMSSKTKSDRWFWQWRKTSPKERLSPNLYNQHTDRRKLI